MDRELTYKKNFPSLRDTALLIGGVEDVGSSVLVLTVLIIGPACVQHYLRQHYFSMYTCMHELPGSKITEYLRM